MIDGSHFRSGARRGAKLAPLALIIASLSLFAAAQKGIGIAVGQPGTPVTIAAVTASPNYYYSSVKVVNRSQREVVGIDFGADAFANDPGHPSLVGPFLLSVHIAPGVAVTAPLNAMPVAFPGLGSGVKELRLGVMSVHYSDGSNWTYRYAAENSFTPGVAELTDAKVAPCGHVAAADPRFTAGAEFPHVAAFLPPPINYKCQGTAIFEYCDNQNTKCTDAGCALGQGCAYQECQAIIPPSRRGTASQSPATATRPAPAVAPLRPQTEPRPLTRP